MAYVPGCSADVFISYAHRDNEDGWVARLKKRLVEKLNPFLAGRADVWFDDRIEPGVYFQREIQAKLRNTPIFVAVVSPSYLESNFCIFDELTWFQDQGGKDVIQLLKVPLDEGQEVPIPDSDYKVLHDPKDGHLLEGPALENSLDEVVAAITKRLRELWDLRPKIYLAQLREDELKSRWGDLWQALHVEGYAVVPKGILPPRVPDGRIREWMEGARVSVHVARVQNDPLALRQLDIAKQIGKPALVLPGVPAADEIPNVVAEVQKQLESNRKPAVYFIYDHYTDWARAAGMTELLRLRTGCEVFLPEAGEKYHRFRLQISDGVLLFRSDAPEDWLESQEQVLLQAAARRERRTVAEAKYITRRPNGHPVGVRSTIGQRQEWIIERIGEPTVDDLEPFFTALRSHVNLAAGGPTG